MTQKDLKHKHRCEIAGCEAESVNCVWFLGMWCCKKHIEPKELKRIMGVEE